MSFVQTLLIALAICSAGDTIAGTRGVRLQAADESAPEKFAPAESVALFVGVRKFTYDRTVAEVPYAVDDAVDLACTLALSDGVRLVDPSRVILALSGDPQKAESQRNLARLVAAGARVRAAAKPDILNALDEQSHAAGSNGVLIFAFATHGFAHDGIQYLLSASAIVRHNDGAISENEIRDIASQSDAARSLILIDACRERLTDGRSTQPDARSAAALLAAMDGVHGQIVLSAAAAGQYAYDDEERHNGVFTAAVIDGLRCQAAPNERGLITVDALSAFVEQHVLTWIRKHRNPRVTHATQISLEGSAKAMPLAACRGIDGAHQRSSSIAKNAATLPQKIAVAVFDDRGEPNAQLIATATDSFREDGLQVVAVPRSVADKAMLQQLAMGRVDSLGASHLSKFCRAVFAGTVTRTAFTETDASLDGLIATRLRLRFFLIESHSGILLSSVDAEARGGGFSKDSSEIQAWERAAEILRAEMRKVKWTEMFAAP